MTVVMKIYLTILVGLLVNLGISITLRFLIDEDFIEPSYFIEDCFEPVYFVVSILLPSVWVIYLVIALIWHLY